MIENNILIKYITKYITYKNINEKYYTILEDLKLNYIFYDKLSEVFSDNVINFLLFLKSNSIIEFTNYIKYIFFIIFKYEKKDIQCINSLKNLIEENRINNDSIWNIFLNELIHKKTFILYFKSLLNYYF